MATALLVLAAIEDEPDKTPFYLAGAVLVAFAIILSVIGLRGGERFPGSMGARNGICALAAVLVAAAMATAVITA